MRHVMLLLGMGTALIASNACRQVPSSPLAAAAAANDVDVVRRLLGAGAPPDVRDGGWTALMWAARAGGTDVMQLLIDAGADVNARDDRNHWTPLLHAVQTQQAGAVALLLAHGADPNAIEPAGRATPLLMAATASDPAVVKLLLEYGADPRYENAIGSTPLTVAVSGGALNDDTDPAPAALLAPLFGGCRLETVRALLAHDPSLRIPKTPAGRRAIWWARFHGCEEVLASIGERPTVRGQTLVGFAGLMHDEARQILRDAPPPTRATDAPSRR